MNDDLVVGMAIKRCLNIGAEATVHLSHLNALVLGTALPRVHAVEFAGHAFRSACSTIHVVVRDPKAPISRIRRASGMCRRSSEVQLGMLLLNQSRVYAPSTDSREP